MKVSNDIFNLPWLKQLYICLEHIFTKLKHLYRKFCIPLHPSVSDVSLVLPVFCPPPFDKTHPNGAHAGKLVHSLKSLIHWLGQQCCKFLIVEDLQIAPLKDFRNKHVWLSAYMEHEEVWRLNMLEWLIGCIYTPLHIHPITAERRTDSPGGILHTVAGCQPYRWLQFGLWTKIALSLRHSANTSPPM